MGNEVSFAHEGSERHKDPLTTVHTEAKKWEHDSDRKHSEYGPTIHLHKHY